MSPHALVMVFMMSGMPTHDLAFHVESEFEPNTTPRGTPIPYHAERFGSTSHIAPSIPTVEATSHIPARPRVSDCYREKFLWLGVPQQTA